MTVRDPDDLWVLASALAGGSEVLVTGDQDLLVLHGTVPLPVLSPRGLWTGAPFQVTALPNQRMQLSRARSSCGSRRALY